MMDSTKKIKRVGRPVTTGKTVFQRCFYCTNEQWEKINAYAKEKKINASHVLLKGFYALVNDNANSV